MAQLCWGRCQGWSRGCWAGPEAAGVVTERGLMGAQSRGGETTERGRLWQWGRPLCPPSPRPSPHVTLPCWGSPALPRYPPLWKDSSRCWGSEPISTAPPPCFFWFR